MPAKSEAQRRLMGMALAIKRGKLTSRPQGMSTAGWKRVRGLASSMTAAKLEEFSSRPRGRRLPKHVPKKRRR